MDYLGEQNLQIDTMTLNLRGIFAARVHHISVRSLIRLLQSLLLDCLVLRVVEQLIHRLLGVMSRVSDGLIATMACLCVHTTSELDMLCLG